MRMGRVLVAIPLVVVMAACGGGDDDAAAPTTSTGPLTCTSSDGLTFTTAMDTCEEAFDKGRQLAAELGLATQPDAPAAEQAVAKTCQTIQGTVVQAYSTPETATLAERLNSSGVCPGSLDMLVPPTTAPAPIATALVESAGWTLVDVVDSETLDVVGADGQQLRVRLIGINAPAQGECMADLAVNVLRFVASNHELKLVPDVSDVDPNGLKLRYVEQVDGVDLGAEMIEQGVAVIESTEPDVARAADYAPVQEAAQAAGAGFWAPDACPTATTVPDVSYANCDEARAAGVAPIHAGEPGYSAELDRDGDGIACDT